MAFMGERFCVLDRSMASLRQYWGGAKTVLVPEARTMTTMKDLKGFCYPLTPGGTSSLVGEMPWHYAAEYVNIVYRADPAPSLPICLNRSSQARSPILHMSHSVNGGLYGTISRKWRLPTQSARNIESAPSGWGVPSRAHPVKSACKYGLATISRWPEVGSWASRRSSGKPTSPNIIR